MARRATRKPYLIQWHQTAQPTTVSREVWMRYVSDRLTVQIGKYLAVVKDGVTARLHYGELSLTFAPSYRIRNSWQSWEIAWLFAVKGGMPANVAMMGLFAKQEYAIAEQQKDIDNEAAMWRISRAKAPKLSR